VTQTGWRLVAKRALDRAIAGVGLVVASPVMAATALAVRANLGSPVLFRQTRPGRDGQPFELLKFRTMRDGTGSDDERLTSVGRFLRATSLDELPQLVNVLRGELSLVGPRPLLVRYLSRYSPEQARRHEVRPGITGNAVLGAALAKMHKEGLDGSVYTHPIGLNGHGAGPLIGLWDYQEGVPGRGDHPVIDDMWFSSELQVTTPVPEWGGQPVRMALEEDFIVNGGKPRWALKRQDRLHLVR